MNYLNKCFIPKSEVKSHIKSKLTNDILEIELYGFVGMDGITRIDIENELNNNIDKCKEIMLHLNSGGGEVLEGFDIYDYFHKYKDKLNVIVDKAACSIASVIALSGKSLQMAPNSHFMIHAPYSATEGDCRELRKQSNYLETIENRLTKFYSEVLKKPFDEIYKKVVDESWFDEYQAIDYGIASGIYKGSVNCLPINMYEYSKFTKDELYNLIERKTLNKTIKGFKDMNDKVKAELLKIKNELEETAKEADQMLKEDEAMAVAETVKPEEPMCEDVAPVLPETPEEEATEPMGEPELAPSVDKELLTEVLQLLADTDGNISTDDILEVLEIQDPMAAIKAAGIKGKARIMNSVEAKIKNRNDFKTINVVKNQTNKVTPLEGVVSDRRIDFSRLSQLK